MALSVLLFANSAWGQTPLQTSPGAGNVTTTRIAKASPLVQSAFESLVDQTEKIQDRKLRAVTLDAIRNQKTCVQHRINVTPEVQKKILNDLIKAGLINLADGESIPGGPQAGVFPPLLKDGSSCPQLPQPFFAAPGSSFGSHHSEPGGLAIHEIFNDFSGLGLGNNYRRLYGFTNSENLPVVNSSSNNVAADIFINEDILIAAPIWHDWSKTIVFQWNADGTEFQEFNFGGNGTTDNYGAKGDSRTGGHHILSLAEAMKRGLAPDFVITQASAHSAPSLGNEYKVVNWLNTAAIIAQIDPVAQGYLFRNSQNQLRLPPLRQLGKLDLTTANQTNLLAEYSLHNLSDADFVLSIPAVTISQTILSTVAPKFGYNSTDVSNYYNKFRNPVLSYLSAERLLIIYGNKGLDGVVNEINKLRNHKVI